MDIAILFGVFVLLLVIGVPVAYSLAAAALATLFYIGLPPLVLAQQVTAGAGSASLVAIPLFILAGEITSIDLPSVSWDSISNSTGNKVRLFVRFVLKDLKTGEIIWEEPKKLYTTDFTDRTITTTGEDEALKVIIEDMSEDIYLGVLNKIRRMDRKAAAGN